MVVVVVSGAEHLNGRRTAARPAVAGDKVFALAGRRAEAARTEFGFERIRRRNLGTGPFVLQTLRETKRQQLLDEASAGG